MRVLKEKNLESESFIQPLSFHFWKSAAFKTATTTVLEDEETEIVAQKKAGDG